MHPLFAQILTEILAINTMAKETTNPEAHKQYGARVRELLNTMDRITMGQVIGAPITTPEA